MSLWRRHGLNATLAVGATLVTLAVAEIAIRLVWTTERVTVEHDPLLGFRGRGHVETVWTREMAGQPRIVRLNEGGFHDHERDEHPPPGHRRLAFVGDSFLEAYQVDIDSSFAQRLGRRLRATTGPTEAVNLGVHGYGLGSLALFVRHRLPAWNPDAVMLTLFLGNDLHDNFTPIASPAVPRFHVSDGQLVAVPPAEAGPRIWLRDHVLARSMLIRFLWVRVIKTSGGAMQLARAAGMVSTPDLESSSDGRAAELLAVAEHLLQQIVSDLRAADVPLHVLVIPDPFHIHDIARGVPLSSERVAIDEAIPAMLQSLGVSYTYPRELFLERRLQDRGVYRRGFGHFTDEAHVLVADLLESPARALLR